MDWTKIGDETVELLRRDLRIDTTNPPGNETAGARFLAQVLDGDGIASVTVESAPGRGNFVARPSPPSSFRRRRGSRCGSRRGATRATGPCHIPPEAVADLDCRMLAGEDPEEIMDWVRQVIADPHVEVSLTSTPKVPNLSSPDTELYKSLAGALRRRASGVVVAPEIMVGFTDNWVFRRCGLHAYGFGPFVLDEEKWRRSHGNDERISVENLTAGVRCYTEMLLDMAAA